MDIHAKSGRQVTFLHSLAHGHIPDRENAAANLVLGRTYTVDGTVVHGFSTDVYLKEIPGVSFNSCHFEDFPEALGLTLTPPRAHRSNGGLQRGI